MRISSGVLRPHHIKQPKIKDLRATPYTVRIAIIKALGDRVRRARILDLFAGSGSLGLDCLSCGAREATFIDLHEDSVRKIHESLKILNLIGRGHIYRESCEGFIKRVPNNSYDLVFFTPPYTNLHLFLLPRIRRIVAEDGLLIVEHPPSIETSQLVESSKHFNLSSKLDFGWSRVALLSPAPQNQKLTVG